MTETATAPGPWYEVQGQSEDGTWHGIYHFTEPADARRTMMLCVESDDPIHTRWEDFRIAVPNPVALRKKARRKGDCWAVA